MPAAQAEAGVGPKAKGWYSYAIVRAVPHVERGEFINVGVILFARTLGFLEARFVVDDNRLSYLYPNIDLAAIRRHLDGIDAMCRGLPEAGPLAVQPRTERFHWLTSPRSTVIQPSPVHVGWCEDPAATIEELVDRYVRVGPLP
jgi:hypothetical protein